MLILLSATAGCIDAISYLGMGQVFTAAMTGNTVLLAIALGQGDVLTALRSLMVLVGFMAGGVLGAVIVQHGSRPGWSWAITAALAVETAILLAITLGWHLAGDGPGSAGLHLLVAVTGVAMGLQSVAVNRLGVAGIATTYVTGTLTHLAMRFAHWMRPGVAPDAAGRQARGRWLPAGVWLAYGAGALAAGAIKLLWPGMETWVVAGEVVHWHTVAMALSILPVAIVVVLALFRPDLNAKNQGSASPGA